MYLAGTRLNHSAKATTHMPSQGARHARIFQPTGQPHKTGARKNNINNNKKTKLNSSRSHSRCPSERSPSITAPRNEEAGRSSGRLAPAPARGPLAPAAAIALRPESPESSSGLKVLSCSSIVVPAPPHPHPHIPAFPSTRNRDGATPPALSNHHHCSLPPSLPPPPLLPHASLASPIPLTLTLTLTALPPLRLHHSPTLPPASAPPHPRLHGQRPTLRQPLPHFTRFLLFATSPPFPRANEQLQPRNLYTSNLPGSTLRTTPSAPTHPHLLRCWRCGCPALHLGFSTHGTALVDTPPSQLLYGGVSHEDVPSTFAKQICESSLKSKRQFYSIYLLVHVSYIRALEATMLVKVLYVIVNAKKM
nr:proline-rich receptor-like protein kinase PERK2 [Physcomitrium patens]|eukprot:XP_024360016.1 proline-rich receptor-like protein kinase PERK2 [Physcomitrella patens]